MFDLKRAERSILIFLLAALLIGLCAAAYQKFRREPEIRIGRFNPESEGVFPRYKVDINNAGQKELESLKGVGSAIAGRISEYRQSHGAFASIEEIKNVKGIGPALFDKIKDDITAGE